MAIEITTTTPVNDAYDIYEASEQTRDGARVTIRATHIESGVTERVCVVYRGESGMPLVDLVTAPGAPFDALQAEAWAAALGYGAALARRWQRWPSGT